MKKIFTTAVALLGAFSLLAEGYQVNLQSTKQTGMGHVGTAMKLGAESMHFNPAGMVYMTESVDLSAGASAISAKVKYTTPNGSTAKTDNPLSTPIYFYAGFNIYEGKLAAGISVTTPYGSSLDWGTNWAGATSVQSISLKSFVYQPTVSVKIVDGLTFGAGLMVATGDFTLSRALMSAAKFQYIGTLPIPQPYKDLIAQYKGLVPASAELGGTSSVRFGYNLGLMFDPCEKVSIGVSYRSKIKMQVDKGNATLTYASLAIEQMLSALGQMNPALSIPPLDQGTFDASLPLPSNFNIGVSYKATERWLFALDAQFVGWKAYDRLKVTFTENVLNGYSIDTPKDYKNTISYRFGAQYVTTDRLTLRGGVYFDETPVRSAIYNPETPGNNKLGFSLGLTFEPYKNFCIDFAALYINGIARNGSYTNPLDPNDVFAGKYKSTAFSASLGLAYKF